MVTWPQKLGVIMANTSMPLADTQHARPTDLYGSKAGSGLANTAVASALDTDWFVTPESDVERVDSFVLAWVSPANAVCCGVVCMHEYRYRKRAWRLGAAMMVLVVMLV